MSFGQFSNAYDPVFDSAWAKWTHGLRHARALWEDVDKAAVNGVLEPVRSVRAEYDSRRHGFAVYPEHVAVMSSEWGLKLGDIAHNYRSCLDHTAWAIVTRGKTPPEALTEGQRQSVYFPMASGRDQFNRDLPRKLPGARRSDIAVVRRRQPYHYRRPGRDRHFLTVLNVINNGDKHRTLQPVWAYPRRVDIEVRGKQGCDVELRNWPRRHGPLEVDGELTFIRARKTGDAPHLDVSAMIWSEPSIGQRIGLRTWIVQCAVFTALLLREFSEPPIAVQDPGLWEWFRLSALQTK